MWKTSGSEIRSKVLVAVGAHLKSVIRVLFDVAFTRSDSTLHQLRDVYRSALEFFLTAMFYLPPTTVFVCVQRVIFFSLYFTVFPIGLNRIHAALFFLNLSRFLVSLVFDTHTISICLNYWTVFALPSRSNTSHVCPSLTGCYCWFRNFAIIEQFTFSSLSPNTNTLQGERKPRQGNVIGA